MGRYGWSTRYENAGVIWVVSQLTGVIGGVNAPESRVGPVGIVLPFSRPQRGDLGAGEGGELVGVEQLVADPAR